jgi:hypothetical protein
MQVGLRAGGPGRSGSIGGVLFTLVEGDPPMLPEGNVVRPLVSEESLKRVAQGVQGPDGQGERSSMSPGLRAERGLPLTRVSQVVRGPFSQSAQVSPMR